MLACVGAAHRAGLDSHTWKLALFMFNMLLRGGGMREGLEVMKLGLRAAERDGASIGQIRLLRHVAIMSLHLGLEEDAVAELGRALALSAELDDPALLAQAHRSMALVCGRLGRYGEALEHGQVALRRFEELGNATATVMTRNSVGWYFAHLGRFTEAMEHCRRALEGSRSIGDRFHTASALDSIGYIHHCQGDHRTAVTYFREVLDDFALLTSRHVLSVSAEHLGDAYHALGELDAAREAWQRALAIPEGPTPAESDRIRGKLRGVRH